MDFLNQYKEEVEIELSQILQYWEQYAVDNENGGFYGFIDIQNQVDVKASRGLVLNARILWAFSAAYQHTKNERHYQLAHRAYEYLTKYFLDNEFGGLYWEVDYQGKPLNTRKQVYGQAFGIYSLCEYYKITQAPKVLYLAIELFKRIEEHSFDKQKGGYFEALTREWETMEDVRLSPKDANEKKTMNTHLHILEAYTNLYRIWQNKQLQRQIEGLIEVYHAHIIDSKKWYQHLFLTENWEVKSDIISFGHDVEAAWLLQEAAEVLENEEIIKKTRQTAYQLAKSASKGLDTDWGLSYEFEQHTLHLDKDKHSWVQAEAMVGFMNAYQISGEEVFLNKSWAIWLFTKARIIDNQKGEWFWGVTPDYKPMNEVKVGFWKCPYHNTRACLEISHRISQILNTQNIAQESKDNVLKMS